MLLSFLTSFTDSNEQSLSRYNKRYFMIPSRGDKIHIRRDDVYNLQRSREANVWWWLWRIRENFFNVCDESATNVFRLVYFRLTMTKACPWCLVRCNFIISLGGLFGSYDLLYYRTLSTRVRIKTKIILCARSPIASPVSCLANEIMIYPSVQCFCRMTGSSVS